MSRTAGPPAQGAGPPVQGAGPLVQGAGPPAQGAGPPAQGAGPPVQGAGPPSAQGAGPPAPGARPLAQGARPLVPTNIPQLDGAEPDISPDLKRESYNDAMKLELQLQRKRIQLFNSKPIIQILVEVRSRPGHDYLNVAKRYSHCLDPKLFILPPPP